MQATRIPQDKPSRSIRKKKEELFIIHDDLDFGWTKKDMQKVIELWNDGMSLEDIAKQVRPPRTLPIKRTIDGSIDETFLLLFHLSRNDKIHSRQGGLLGK